MHQLQLVSPSLSCSTVVLSPWESPFFNIFSHKHILKKRIFEQNIYNAISKCRSYSFDSSPKYPPKFFFLPLFLKILLFGLKILYTITVFDLIWQFIPNIYDFISEKIQLVDRLSCFKICRDSKFAIQGKISKKKWLEIALFWKFLLNYSSF